MATLNPPPFNNAINVYLYEGFNFAVPNPSDPSFTLLPVSNTSGLDPTSVYFTKNANRDISFSVSDLSNKLSTGTETFKVTVTNGSNPPLVSTNTVTINPGRFLDGSGQSLTNNVYTFYKNEPVLPGTLRLVAPSFTLRTPTAFLSLPPGLGFSNVALNVFDIVGTPSVPVGSSNYQIIGVESGGSKIVTTTITIVVSNERLRVNLPDQPIVGGMQIGVPITPRIITAIPPSTGGTVEYRFPRPLPDGIVVRDLFGTVQPANTTLFIPNPVADPSYTMIIEGTPTLAAANAFRDAGVDSTGQAFTIQATRTSPLPQLSNTIPLVFQFAPTVLFDTPSISNIFVGVPVNLTSNFFQAFTYFVTAEKISNIVSISSPDLRSDLSLVYVSGSSRADLSGTNPTLPAETANYTIRAVNSCNISQDISVPITVVNDFITFQPPTPVDPCYSFILSRPASLAKPDYYPSNIQFRATAASGLPVQLSTPGFAGTGLSLDSNGLLIGTPTQVTPLTTLSVIANAVGSPATASTTIRFSILDDTFTFADVDSNSLRFVQNRRITDVVFPVTTLSERTIIGFSQTGLPAGLSINPAGVVSGTPLVGSPTTGTATITATTGYVSGSRTFGYTLIPDTVLILPVPPISILPLKPGELVGPVQLEAVASSGINASNFQFSNLSPTYGFTINSTTGLFNGTLETGLPPQQLFPDSVNFQIQATAGSATGSLDVSFITQNAYKARSFITLQDVDIGSNTNQTSIYASDNFSNWTLFSSSIPKITDFNVQYTDQNSNEINYLSYGNIPEGIYRYTDGRAGFEQLSNVYGLMRAFTTDGQGTWYAVANAQMNEDTLNPTAFMYFTGSLLRSTDNGLTWSLVAEIPGLGNSVTDVIYYPRNLEYSLLNASNALRTVDPYRNLGISLRYKDNVLLLGGAGGIQVNPNDLSTPVSSAVMRSVDGGLTWTRPTDFTEIAGFNLDDDDVWLAYGSVLYRTDPHPPFSPPNPSSTTIRYSTDKGATWYDCENEATYMTYDITYGNGRWIATGERFFPDPAISQTQTWVVSSDDGVEWMPIPDIPRTLGTESSSSSSVRVGPTMFNGTTWNVFSVELRINDPLLGVYNRTMLYSHPADGDLADGWTSIDLRDSFPDRSVSESTSLKRFLFLGYTPNNVIQQNGEPISFLEFASGTGGPTFTSPTTQSFLLYQYVSISPIQIVAQGTGNIVYFVRDTELPPGLSFDRTTAEIRGASVQIGTNSVTVYAKDDNGTRTFVLNFTTVLPRIIRKQDGAAAYTSLLRQYTEVLGAQSARDNRALPTELTTLGEFMSPVPPAVVTVPSNPNCDAAC
jgi:hypothetical protein